MQIADFRRIVTTFADPGTDFLFEHNRVVLEVNNALIEVTLRIDSGEVMVTENDIEQRSEQWILKRLARLPLLADRLLAKVPETPAYIAPEAQILKSLEVKPDDEIISASNALEATVEALDSRSPLETTILYVTSDAGEGKTSLINQMARTQAQKFKVNQSSWLLVPIPLGGRNFLRFDDIVVGALANRYRFTNFYYASFLELVRMGVLVPAFDGFEEMFVENSSGEALSAMGGLVNALQSEGAAIVAARTAYFEFQNLKTQAKLYDTLKTYSVGFGKVELSRWSRQQFILYCQARSLPNAESLYSKVTERLGADHPLVARPVLAKRLVDIAENSASLDELLTQLSISGADFFSTFVRGIIEREATEKWIDRSGELSQPLMSVDQHCEMLAQVALEMWQSRVDFLKSEMLEFVADYYCEINRMSAAQTVQVRERLRGHALLVVSTNAVDAFEFDHDEFRQYFLGEAIARMCLSEATARKSDLLNTLRKASLPGPTTQTIIHAFDRASAATRKRGIELLSETALLDGQTSFTHENCTSLVLPLISNSANGALTLRRMSFAQNALRDKALSNIRFEECYFAPTSLEATSFDGCSFENCHFNRLDIFDSTKIMDVALSHCVVECVHLIARSQSFFAPEMIEELLKETGFNLSTESDTDEYILEFHDKDQELVQFEKILRYLNRSTHISESVISMKLGEKSQIFIDDQLPRLLRTGLFVEIQQRGGSLQRRFKLDYSMVAIQTALETCDGSFNTFLEAVTSLEPQRPSAT